MFILVNLKAYDVDAVDVARAARRVAGTSAARIGVAPPSIDIRRTVDVGPEIWAQHIDGIEPGSHTGSLLAESVAEAGATGTILNHSECRLRIHDLERAVAAANRAGLETVVCANNPEQIRAVTALGPDAVAVEPPALIGTGTPVSQADPDVVENAVTAAASVDPEMPVLCGAGIGSGEDVIAAHELGADGVLLASGVAKAPDPAAVLEDLVAPLE